MSLKTRRRDFLFLSAGAALAPSLSWASSPASVSKARASLKLGVASYSFRKHPLDKVIEWCRELDVQYVTVKDMHMPLNDPPEALLAARQKIEAAGITLLGGGVITMKKNPEQIRKYFEYARACGFPRIVGMPEPDALDIVEAMVKEFKIPLAIHNHGPEDKFFPLPQDVLKAIKGRDKGIGVCIDIGHTLRSGGDPVQSVFDCKDRLLDMHVKDLKSKTRGSDCSVGMGIIDIPGVFRALLKVGFQGHAALEYETHPDDPLPGVKESFAYMRGVLDAL